MPALTELTQKLSEIFQIDRADLDFGIYRILNSRNEQITHYLNHTLPNTVTDKLAKNSDMETAVYRHLLTFFSRYYEEGDFISQRRYKGDTYAIPYNGEEVVLHWANKDQYYTKSGENFTNYRFDLADGRQVFFKLNAADTAKDNQKDNDTKRFFALSAYQNDENGNAILPISQSDDGQTLTILFDYKPFPKSTKQEKLIADDLATIFANETVATHWQALAEKSPTEKNKDRTLLEKHLSDYTAKNTADYFIHKDLGGFLKRELDFYIKNEVMNLDDIDNALAFADIEHNLRLIQTLRHIAYDIIAFLAQLENFQKRLWEKKKFVADCHYLITLDNIDEKFHEEIFANPKQLDEWQNLYGADNIQRENAYLVVNTSLFSQSFQAKLLGSFDELDNQINGTIIHSDNFQALNLLQAKYQGQVKCIYIDPPFNLGSNGDFLYKTDYKDSSWLTLLENRVSLSKNLISDNGYFYLRCDHNGNSIARLLLNNCFGFENFESELLVQRIRKNTTNQGKITLPLANDSLFLYSKSEKSSFANPYLHLKETRKAYWRRIDDSAGFRNPPERKIFGKIFVPYKYDAHFKYSQTSIDKMILEGRIRLKCKSKSCKYEYYNGIWTTCPECGSAEATPQYLVLESNTQILDTNWLDIAGYSHTTGFSTENSEVLLTRVIDVASQENDIIMDYFSGSGTTLAVAIKSKRRFIGIEQGEQLQTIIIPRIAKVIFNEKMSQIVKVLKLESYEDTLNNLVLQQSDLFDKLPESTQNDYLLNYMLAIESRESLLNVADFAHPFDYELNISANSAGAFVRQKIDLVETFNYLVGATVLGIDDRRDSKGYVEIECRLPRQNDDERTLIFWRDCDKLGYDELKAMFVARHINPKESTYQEIYINGDHTLDTVWESADGVQSTLKVKSIEQEFLTLMFGAI